jgi:hypothetical protein
MPKADSLPVSTGRAADLLGISPSQFRRIAAALGLEPEAYVINPHAPGGPPCPVWALADVERAARSAEVAAARARRQWGRAASAAKAFLRGAASTHSSGKRQEPLRGRRAPGGQSLRTERH